MLAGSHHGSRVDHLAAHLGGGAIYGSESGGEGVSGVNDAAVHSRLADLGGDFLDIGSVSQAVGNSGFIDAIIGEDLLGILAHGYVAVTDGQKHVAALQQLGQLVETLDPLRIAFRHSQGHLVLQQVQTGALQHTTLFLQRVHL